MKKALFLSTFFLLFGCSDTTNKTISDKLGKSDKLTCYFFFISDCPASRNNLPKMQEIADLYPHILDVIGVVPDPDLNQSKLDETLNECGIKFQIVSDPNLNIARKHGATVTPQVMMYDGKKCIYSGKLDDYYVKLGRHKYEPSINYVDLAIQNWQENKQEQISKTEPIGCIINFD